MSSARRVDKGERESGLLGYQLSIHLAYEPLWVIPYGNRRGDALGID